MTLVASRHDEAADYDVARYRWTSTTEDLIGSRTEPRALTAMVAGLRPSGLVE